MALPCCRYDGVASTMSRAAVGEALYFGDGLFTGRIIAPERVARLDLGGDVRLQPLLFEGGICDLGGERPRHDDDAVAIGDKESPG